MLDARASRADFVGEPRAKRPWDWRARDRGDAGEGERGRLSNLTASSEGMTAGGVASERVAGGASVAVKAEASEAIDAAASRRIDKLEKRWNAACSQFRDSKTPKPLVKGTCRGVIDGCVAGDVARADIFSPGRKAEEASEERVGDALWAVSGSGDEAKGGIEARIRQYVACRSNGLKHGDSGKRTEAQRYP